MNPPAALLVQVAVVVAHRAVHGDSRQDDLEVRTDEAGSGPRLVKRTLDIMRRMNRQAHCTSRIPNECGNPNPRTCGLNPRRAELRIFGETFAYGVEIVAVGGEEVADHELTDRAAILNSRETPVDVIEHDAHT